MISAISHSMVCISLAACSATADCVTFPDAKALLCYFRVKCPFCLPNVLFWATATQTPVHYTCLEWVTDLVCLTEQGAGHYSLVDQWVA